MLQVVATSTGIPTEKQFIKWINIISQDTDINKNNITIRIVEAEESQSLNQQFRGLDKPTNVLSFPANLPECVDAPYFGDIVICAQVVEQEAKDQNKPKQAHWAHMLVHGALHLQGYDHISDKQAHVMEALEIKIMRKLGFDNPYDTDEKT